MAEKSPHNAHNHVGSFLEKSPAGGDVQNNNMMDPNEMSEADRALAAEFGYTPVFKRQFGYLSTFSFAVSVGGVFASVATTFSYPLQAGGSASVIWCTYPFVSITVILTISKAGLSRVLGVCALRYVEELPRSRFYSN
jgi:hypothetical protein